MYVQPFDGRTESVQLVLTGQPGEPSGSRDWRTRSERRQPGDPDYYWADPETGSIKWTKHCLWEEVK